MPTAITMPQLGESVTEGTVVRWLKREGERVERDEPLFEVTTDKVNADMPSPVAGILVRRLVEEGAVVPIGAQVAEVDEQVHGAAVGNALRTEPIVEQAVAIAQTAPGPVEAAEHDMLPAGMAPAANGAPGDDHRRYTPLVRKLAAEHGIDPRQVTGSGLNGRVTRDDMLAFIAHLAEPKPPAAMSRTENAISSRTVTKSAVLEYVGRGSHPAPPEPVAVTTPPVVGSSRPPFPPEARIVDDANAAESAMAVAGPDEEFVPLSAMRRGIAEHMVRSKHLAPHATTVIEVDMTRLVRWREANRAAIRAREAVDMSFVVFVVQSVVLALKQFPYLNSSWGGDKIILKKRINIGIAVGLDDGLLVPVIHNADEHSLLGLARALAELTARARQQRLAVQDIQGGTFTLNNTGAFGSLVSTPVINQPQAAILSMEAIVKRPVVVDDAIAIRSMMNLSLSIDHRIVDGLMAGRFLARIKKHLEQFPLPDEA